MLITQEHYDLMDRFEAAMKIRDGRAKKEEKSLWSKGAIYCHGETNELFLAYRHGHAYGKCLYQENAND